MCWFKHYLLINYERQNPGVSKTNSVNISSRPNNIATINTHLLKSPKLEKLLATSPKPGPKLFKHAAIKGAETELRDAEEEVEGLVDEGLTWRIQQASEARAKATKAEVNPERDDHEDRENLSLNLQKMIDDKIWVRKKT